MIFSAIKIYQLIIAVPLLILIVRCIRNLLLPLKTRLLTLIELLSWSLALVMVLDPNIGHIISKFFGFGENLNTLIFIAILIVFFIDVQLFTRTEKQNSQITALTREVALKDIRRK